MNLNKNIFSGLKWTGLSSVITLSLQMIQVAVLARILAPEDFGLMALALVFIGLAQTVSDGGITNAVIQKQNILPRVLNSLYWFNIIIACVLSLFMNALAYPIAVLFGQNDLQAILHILSVIFIVQAVGQQYHALLKKDLHFNKLAVINIVSRFVAFIAILMMALNGFGVYALVYGALLEALCKSLGYLGVGCRLHKATFYYQWADVKSFLSFGGYQIGDRFINFFTGQSDRLLIGYFLGAEILGFYALAWQLIVFPAQKLNPILTQVMFPIYSKLQTQKTVMVEYFTKTLFILGGIGLPFFIVVVAFPEDIIRLVYGEGWQLTISLLPFLAIVGFVKVLLNPIGSFVIATDRVDLPFKMNALWCVSTIIVLAATLWLYQDVSIMAQALAVLSLIFACLWYVVLRKVINN